MAVSHFLIRWQATAGFEHEAPLGEGEMRVSLTFEYVTDPKMHLGGRFISDMKDALAYFGFRQVFRRRARTGLRHGRERA